MLAAVVVLDGKPTVLLVAMVVAVLAVTHQPQELPELQIPEVVVGLLEMALLQLAALEVQEL
jgi:hypothetical protein